MKKLSKKLNWFIITYGIIICLCFLLIVLDYCNAFSRIGGESSRFNWGFISIIASFFCGFSSVLAVFFTIWTEKNNREIECKRQDEIRNKERKRFEDDRKDEEKKKAKPFFASLSRGRHPDVTKNVTIKIKGDDSQSSRNRYYLSVLTDAIGTILLYHSDDFYPVELPKAIGRDTDLIVDVFQAIKTGDFFVAEDVLGNRYKYMLEVSFGSEISIGFPQECTPNDLPPRQEIPSKWELNSEEMKKDNGDSFNW